METRHGVPLLLAPLAGRRGRVHDAAGRRLGRQLRVAQPRLRDAGRPPRAWPRTAGARSWPRARDPLARGEPAAAPRQRRASRRAPCPGSYLDAATAWPEGDALVTSQPGLPLVAHGADCLTAALVAPADAPRGRARGLARARRRRARGGRRARRTGLLRGRRAGRRRRAATPWARTSPARCGRASATTSSRTGAPTWRPAPGRALERGGAAAVVRRRALHDLRRRALPLAPPRRRGQRPAGRHRLSWRRPRERRARGRAREPRRRARGDRRGGAPLGPRGRRGRAARGGQVRGARGHGDARRGRHRARRREPRRAAAGQAGGRARPLRLGLHRPPAEPQGARPRRAACASCTRSRRSRPPSASIAAREAPIACLVEVNVAGEDSKAGPARRTSSTSSSRRSRSCRASASRDS